jgi:Domain of unknown function (DUF4407)
MSVPQRPEMGFQQHFFTLEFSFGNQNEDANLLKISVLQQIFKQKHGLDVVAANLPELFQPAFINWVAEHLQAGFGLNLTRDAQRCIVKITTFQAHESPLKIQMQVMAQTFDGLILDTSQCIFSAVKQMQSELNSLLERAHVHAERTTHYAADAEANRFLSLPRKTPLFWSLSGASIALLRESYTDQNRYKNLGAAILVTGCFAALSMGFALTYITQKWWAIIPIALLWGVAIVNIDMLVINTVRKTGKWSWRNFGGFWARVLLGTIIAISISVPLEMTILQDEIRDEIDRYDRASVEAEVAKAKAEYADLPSLKARQTELSAQFIDEMQGKPTASGYRGYGVIAQKMEAELKSLDTTIAQLEAKRDVALSGTSTQITEQQNANGKYGFLASFRALHRLEFGSADRSVLYISLGIKALLLMIELMPILAKALMPMGGYDRRMRAEDLRI